jgi:hypothetical protein
MPIAHLAGTGPAGEKVPSFGQRPADGLAIFHGQSWRRHRKGSFPEAVKPLAG